MRRTLTIILLIGTTTLALAATSFGAAGTEEAAGNGPGWRITGFFHELVGYLKRSDQVDEGDMAPDFALTPLRSYDLDLGEAKGPSAADEANIRLSAFRGFKPVALVFGSYT